jgi:hypothetical protein
MLALILASALAIGCVIVGRCGWLPDLRAGRPKPADCCKNPPVLAHVWERWAERLLTLLAPPDVGPGGEVIRQQAAPEGHAQNGLKNKIKPLLKSEWVNSGPRS